MVNQRNNHFINKHQPGLVGRELPQWNNSKEEFRLPFKELLATSIRRSQFVYNQAQHIIHLRQMVHLMAILGAHGAVEVGHSKGPSRVATGTSFATWRIVHLRKDFLVAVSGTE